MGFAAKSGRVRSDRLRRDPAPRRAGGVSRGGRRWCGVSEVRCVRLAYGPQIPSAPFNAEARQTSLRDDTSDHAANFSGKTLDVVQEV